MRAPSGPDRRGAACLTVLRVAVPLALLGTAVFLVQATRQVAESNRSPIPVALALGYGPRVAPSMAGALLPPEEPPEAQFTIRRGETLSELFEGLGLGAEEAQTAVEALRPWVDPRKVRAGDAYLAAVDEGRRLASFELRVPGRGRVRLLRREQGWEPRFQPEERSLRPRVARGQLSTSLEEAVEQAGVSSLLAYAMAEVLQWDLDFNRDLRVGDRFEVLFEEVFVDGAYASPGSIVALRYENRGRSFEAYRYGDGGYYDAEGRPLKKMFLRSPLRFSHITSRFSHRRFHPILKTHRPHWGVDYGAPVGTPVLATANGTVTFAGWDGGGGKTVKLRHTGGLLTAYLHLSRFGEGIRPGRAVSQGEVVGYVGATGLATGAHLDYRVQRDGRWIDPLSLASVPARPLGPTELPTFRRWRDAQRASLDAGEPLPARLELPLQIAAAPAPRTAEDTAARR